LKLIEIFKGFMRAICFAGIILAISSLLNETHLEAISGFMIGFGAVLGWADFEE